MRTKNFMKSTLTARQAIELVASTQAIEDDILLDKKYPEEYFAIRIPNECNKNNCKPEIVYVRIIFASAIKALQMLKDCELPTLQY